ncbi:MAG: polyribonucleotide nucleotidyltransferase [Bacteroidia bacterium]|nr:polyribonucleotide nucleotidyltransferase [Bacteroidia bacterium]
MSIQGTTKTFQLEDGRTISIETGKLAKQANGSVVVKMGNCMLLATAVASPEGREGADFLPLSVDYQEKYASVGRFPGGFFKREARLGEHEILICRLVDRALRPTFPEDYHADVQIMITLKSADKEVSPDSLAGLAASAALTISDIPINGPISEVRVCRIDGNYVINPSISDMERADLDLIVAGNANDVNMVEGEMAELSESEMVEAIKKAHEAIKVQCAAQLELAEMIGGVTKQEYEHEIHDEELRAKVKAETYDKVYEVAKTGNPNKKERGENFKAIRETFKEQFGEEELAEKKGLIHTYFHDVEKDAIRNMMMDTNGRLDGRKLDEIRPIWSEVDYLPSAHGSAVFTRGETQSLTTVTLGTKLDEQIIDTAMHSGTKKFLLHYNFPGFSTGEVRPNRGPGRREIGHGHLAWRSLQQVLPTEENNPYTIRVVSDILESNGSSSMATVCAGSLALMDAGIGISSPVSGIAMGMISDGDRFIVLSDILGDEDHLGDMDFKVTGTEKGICACQMDLKVKGLPYDVLIKALEQSKAGRLHILNEMNNTLSQPNSDYKDHAPRIVEMRIPTEYIGAVIGPGGKIIQEMQRESGANISIDEKDGQGVVQISADNKEAIESVTAQIKGIVAVPEVGEVYEGKVKNIMPFGAFIEILPGKDGLLHISEIDWKRIETMDGVFKEGEIVKVKLIDVDSRTGKLKLSRKVLIPRPASPAPAKSE